MISHSFTRHAEQAAIRYGTLVDSWQGLFNQALNGSDFGYADQHTRVVAEGYRMADSFLEIERSEASRVIDEIAREAHQTTLTQIAGLAADDLTDQALDHLSESQSYLLNEMIAQIHRDIALVRQALQRVILEVSISARSRRIPQRQALIEHRIQNSETLKFMFHDRHARKWTSKKFIRAVWRHTLLATYNETVLLVIADHGLERALVVKRVSGALQTIDTVSLVGAAGELSYADALAEHFHPNSDAFLSVESEIVQP